MDKSDITLIAMIGSIINVVLSQEVNNTKTTQMPSINASSTYNTSTVQTTAESIPMIIVNDVSNYWNNIALGIGISGLSLGIVLLALVMIVTLKCCCKCL